jgi:hypothetical protein
LDIAARPCGEGIRGGIGGEDLGKGLLGTEEHVVGVLVVQVVNNVVLMSMRKM